MVFRDPSHIDQNKEYQITELAKFIREKMYGVDTREAMALALERVYEDAAKSGNANMEVSMARGPFGTLNHRLNNIESKKADQAFVDAQFASIVSGAPKGTFVNLQALRDAYPNGEEGVFLVLSNGHWYYWNETEKDWLDGGLYQSVSWEVYMTTQDEEWVI